MGVRRLAPRARLRSKIPATIAPSGTAPGDRFLQTDAARTRDVASVPGDRPINARRAPARGDRVRRATVPGRQFLVREAASGVTTYSDARVTDLIASALDFRP